MLMYYEAHHYAMAHFTELGKYIQAPENLSIADGSTDPILLNVIVQHCLKASSWS